mmetsp:Transcript_11520/g.30797  ORF Transcript_11520/g.30797 Transcript_11520/m.30797 type:complete len:313 (-) Transcript_11520:547-1485(-)
MPLFRVHLLTTKLHVVPGLVDEALRQGECQVQHVSFQKSCSLQDDLGPAPVPTDQPVTNQYNQRPEEPNPTLRAVHQQQDVNRDPVLVHRPEDSKAAHLPAEVATAKLFPQRRTSARAAEEHPQAAAQQVENQHGQQKQANEEQHGPGDDASACPWELAEVEGLATDTRAGCKPHSHHQKQDNDASDGCKSRRRIEENLQHRPSRHRLLFRDRVDEAAVGGYGRHVTYVSHDMENRPDANEASNPDVELDWVRIEKQIQGTYLPRISLHAAHGRQQQHGEVEVEHVSTGLRDWVPQVETSVEIEAKARESND